MARKRYTTEQIIGLLREAEVRSDRVRRLARSVEVSASRSKAIIVGGASTAVEARPGEASQGSGAREQPAQEGGV